MIKQHYSGSARRSVNIIWNAAQSYGFDPPFLAFFANGQPDDYLNMIIGLTVKWLDFERITDFFLRLGQGASLDEASGVLWLGIENCIYGKELPERPVMERMRLQRAKEFFRINSTLSEQQMSFMSMKVYDQEEARWGRLLGRNVLDIGPSARKLARELEFDPSWDTDKVLSKMNEILKVYFRITLPDTPRAPGYRIPGWRKALAKVLPGRDRQTADLLVLRRGSGSGDRKGSVHLTHSQGELPATGNAQKDLEYIQTAFGPCMYTESEMRILEGGLCVENDIRSILVTDLEVLKPTCRDGEGNGHTRTTCTYAEFHSAQVAETLQPVNGLDVVTRSRSVTRHIDNGLVACQCPACLYVLTTASVNHGVEVDSRDETEREVLSE